MKIKEVEKLTGMSRDNIRFYEKEGLLEIDRNDNGYREYNDEHVQILKRIKLLRSLNISIEDIKDIQFDNIKLSNYLVKHIHLLEDKQIYLEKNIKLCRLLIQENVSYHDLNVDSYIPYFDNIELKEDFNKTLNAPFRRYFARVIDLSFYQLLVSFIMIVILRMNIHYELMDLFITILALISMVLIEPWFISKFKTTPGKFILGLYVTDYKGNALSYWEASTRTINLLVYGYGCMIPIVSTIAGIYCLVACSKEKSFIWEDGNIQTLKDHKKSRYVFLSFVFILQIFLNIGLANYSLFPKNRGKLTVAEFVENVNQLNIVYYDDNENILHEDGSWEWIYPDTVGNVNIKKEHPTFHFKEENGELVEVSFTLVYEDGLSIILRDSLTRVALSSFMKAKPSYTPYHYDEFVILSKTNDNFKHTAHGLEVSANYTFNHIGYTNPQVEWIYTFTITKQK